MTEESYQKSLLFNHPLEFSEIKKGNNGINELLGEETSYKINCPSPTQEISPENEKEQFFHTEEKNLNNLDDESSIDFQDDQDTDEEKEEEEIQFLEQEIEEKLEEQFSFIKEKLKQKQQEKENLLKYYRELSTYEPENKEDSKGTETFECGRKRKSNPLNTKKIKEKIIKLTENNNASQSPKVQKVLNEVPRSNISYNHLDFNQKQTNIYINSIKIETIRTQRETPHFTKENKVTNIIFQKNQDQFKFIQEISDELKKMEFRKIEEMAQGKFNFSKRK